MAKSRQQHNRLDIPEETGDGAAEGGGEVEVTGTGGEGGEGKREKATDNSPPQSC